MSLARALQERALQEQASLAQEQVSRERVAQERVSLEGPSVEQERRVSVQASQAPLTEAVAVLSLRGERQVEGALPDSQAWRLLPERRAGPTAPRSRRCGDRIPD